MNNFDLMIEKYRKELIDAKRRSIKEALNEDVVQNSVLPEMPETVEEERQEISDMQGSDYTVSEQNADLLIDNENSESSDNIDSNSSEDVIEGQNVSEVYQPNNAPNTVTGLLRIQIFAADRAYPISSALVTVTGNGNDDEIFFQGYTDTSGIIDNIVLPAPSKEMSEQPTADKPYAQYDIVVAHPRFRSRRYLGVPVFGGIKSVQNVQLVPLDTEEDAQIETQSQCNDMLLKKGESSNG